MTSKKTDWDILQQEWGEVVKGRLGGIQIVRKSVWSPLMDIYETDHEMILQVEVGGLENDDFNVTLEGDELVISGVRKVCVHSEKVQFHHMEIPTGRFERRVEVGFKVVQEDIKASYKSGMLMIVLPKAGKEKSIKIKVRET